MASVTPDLQVNSALHPSGVAKLSTSFGWSKGCTFHQQIHNKTLCCASLTETYTSYSVRCYVVIHVLFVYWVEVIRPEHFAAYPAMYAGM